MNQTKFTYCRICEPACGLKVTLEDGRITEVTGDPDHPLTKGYICARGKATLAVHRDPDRLNHPLKKVDGQWVRAGWDEAIGDIGARLAKIRRQYGRESIAVYFGNPLAFDFSFGIYLPIAMQMMKTRNFFSSGSQDCNNKFAAAQKVFGSPLIHPVPDIERTDFLVLIGSNPAVSHMSFMSLPRPAEKLMDITRRGGRLVVIDPRRTETARLAGEHLFIRPDTDVFLLLALLHVILSEDLHDRAAVAHTRGLDDLKNFAAAFPPERAARITGISADAITALARDFARAQNAGIHASLGINLGSFGTLCYWLVQALNAVTGRLDRPGSMIFCEGPVDMARIYKWRSHNHRPRQSRIGGLSSVLDTLPAGVMSDEILTDGPGQIKALIVASGNPLLSVPDPDRLERAFKSLDLLVSLDLFLNETGALGHYALPGADMYERWDFAMTGLLFNPTRFASYTEAVVPPGSERRATWRVMKDIVEAAGYPDENGKAGAALGRGLDRIGKLIGMSEPLSFPPRLLLRATLALSDISYAKVVANPRGTLLRPHRAGRFFQKRILTTDKKADLAPPEFIACGRDLEDFFEADIKHEGFKLIGRRQRRTHNTWFHNVEGFAAGEGTNRILINPADAARLEIEDGETVEVMSDVGKVSLPAVITDEVMAGVVCVPHGWGHTEESGLSVAKKHPGVNVNKLIAGGPGALEKFAGMAKMTGVRVSVKKAGE